jgi:hypothetical protein
MENVQIKMPNFYSIIKYSPERISAGWKVFSPKIFKAYIFVYILGPNGSGNTEQTSLVDLLKISFQVAENKEKIPRDFAGYFHKM